MRRGDAETRGHGDAGTRGRSEGLRRVAVSPRRRVLLLLVLTLYQAGVAIGDDSAFRAGMPLSEALRQLQRGGLKVVFSTQVVREGMRVEVEPKSTEPRKILEELLAPHHLGVREGPGDVLIVITRSRPPVASTFRGLLRSSPTLAEEIIVQPSQISLLVDEPAAPISLSREEIQTLPHLGDDIFRTVRLLPGTTSNDESAQLHIRGGRRDELLILLDGQELYEPYHLRDYDNALSIVAASALARVQLITAAFPVSYGDRMAGVLNMVTTDPSRQRLRLAASFLGAQVEVADIYQDGRLGWFTSGRRGTTDALGRLFNLEAPSFWDFFGKVDYQITANQNVRVHGLASRDNLGFDDKEARQQRGTEYSSSYLWLTHRMIVGDDLFVDTNVSTTRVRLHRRGFEEDEEERNFEVRDDRELDVIGFLHSWNLQATPRQFMYAGVDYQRFDALYDYSAFREFFTPLARMRAEPREGTFTFGRRIDSEHVSLYASDRLQPLESLTLELGLRYDRQTHLDDHLISPRISAAWAFRERSVLRLGWGHYNQSQRAYELMVEDADTRRYPAERSEHRVIGFEHLFSPSSRIPLAALRVEAYQREVSNPRPRYENLVKAYDAFPEGEFDRVRVEPESAEAEGLELMVRGRATRKIDWWLNYAYASTDDQINSKDVPRDIDHTHTVNLDVNYRHGSGWNINAAWVHRTGAPTTPLTLQEIADELVPVLGPLNSERLPDYFRLDLRISRDWPLRLGTLTVFLDAHNVFNRQNVEGLDVEIDEDTGTLLFPPEYWPGIIPSAGIIWEFR